MSGAEATRKILREGTWLYDGTIECRVVLVSSDFDDEFYGDEGHQPFLNANGLQYYAEFDAPWGYHSRSDPRLSLEDAATLAESIAPSVRWRATEGR